MKQKEIQSGFGDANGKSNQELQMKRGHEASRLRGMMMACVLLWAALGAGLQTVSAANVMNYGADGNDYFQFTTPSMAFDKASGFTTLITFAMHVDADGTLGDRRRPRVLKWCLYGSEQLGVRLLMR